MLCEKCHKTEATVQVTEVVAESPGQMRKRNLCEARWGDTDIAKKLSGKSAGWTRYNPRKRSFQTMSRAANHYILLLD